MLNKSLKFINNTVKLPPEQGRRKYTCYICWRKFLTHKELTEHKTEHVVDDDIEETSKQTVDKTSKVVTKKNLSSTTKNPTIDLTFSPIHKCQTCEASFNSIEAVKKHPPNKCKFVCGVCEKTYNTMYAFTVHILQHKISIFKKQATKSIHKCSLCSQSFQEYFQLKTHGILMHKGKSLEPTTSTVSEKDTDNSTELSCELCFDIFSTPKDLNDHMELHKQLTKSDGKVIEESSADDTLEDNEADGIQAVQDTVTDVTESGTPSLCTAITVAEDVVTIEKPLNDSKEINNEIEAIPVIESSFSLAPSTASISSSVKDVSNQDSLKQDLPDQGPSNEDDGKADLGYESLRADKVIPVDHYRCKKCDRIYMSLDEFNDHIKNKKCTIVEHCKLCKQSFDKNSDLFSHITENHRHLSTCKFCFESFYVLKKLDEHKLLYHFKTFKNLCKICFQCFASFQEFNSHLQKAHLSL